MMKDLAWLTSKFKKYMPHKFNLVTCCFVFLFKDV